MSNKILTISIAAYNVEDFLEETLKSLLGFKETIEKLDVIVVDDGSRDNSSDIAQRYADLYPESFRVIKKENGGHGSTLNTSVREAKGKYFKMLDGDDWYDTDELEILIDELEKTDVDIILCPYNRIYNESGKKEVINRHNMLSGKEYNFLTIVNNMLEDVHAAELTVKTKLLQENGFNITEKCAFTDDEYVFAAMLHANTVKKLRNVVYQYRIGVAGQTVSDSGRKSHWMDAGQVAAAMLRTLVKEMDYVVGDEHLHYLQHIIQRTIDFQCDNFFYADNMSLGKKEFLNFSELLKSIDNEFECYLVEKSYSYGWWKWIISACDVIQKDKSIIFGAGTYGERIYRCLNDNGINIAGIVDNDQSKWGKEKWGMIISEPQTLKNQWSDCKVIVAAKKQHEIVKQLREAGISEDRIIAFGK